MKSYALPEHSQPVSGPIQKGPEILWTKPGDSSICENRDSFTAEYHCTAEWHFARLRSRYTSLLHGFAMRLSNQSGSFYCSQSNLAKYFGCSRRTIWTAIQGLEGSGFFLRTFPNCPFYTNVYTVFDHRTWADRNPGKCVTRIEMPWSKEGQALGSRLHAISGGRVKFYQDQIMWLQARASDEEIERRFRQLLDDHGIPLKAGTDFIDLRRLNWGFP
jgi:hypothetical protein